MNLEKVVYDGYEYYLQSYTEKKAMADERKPITINPNRSIPTIRLASQNSMSNNSRQKLSEQQQQYNLGVEQIPEGSHAESNWVESVERSQAEDTSFNNKVPNQFTVPSSSST